jgi:hypothetical protein
MKQNLSIAFSNQFAEEAPLAEILAFFPNSKNNQKDLSAEYLSGF